jgi:hypothetical protein
MMLLQKARKVLHRLRRALLPPLPKALLPRLQNLLRRNNQLPFSKAASESRGGFFVEDWDEGCHRLRRLHRFFVCYAVATDYADGTDSLVATVVATDYADATDSLFATVVACCLNDNRAN